MGCWREAAPVLSALILTISTFMTMHARTEWRTWREAALVLSALILTISTFMTIQACKEWRMWPFRRAFPPAPD